LALKNQSKTILPPIQKSVTTSDKTSKTPLKTESSNKGNYKILRPTNLQIIEGIGPKMESLLKENGIHDWKALSGKSLGEIRAILDKYGGRYSIVNPETWPKQATLAKKEKWEKLISLQGENGGESKLNKILIKLGIK